MKQNKYDDPEFFAAYQQMRRSIRGLEAAGEWHVWKSLLPNLCGKHVLDLGCGFGWHCRYAREQQASAVVGVDISEKMLQKARAMTDDPAITYMQMAMEDIAFSPEQFDVAISSLAFHYTPSFQEICQKVYEYVKPGGHFLFSVEHPIFTCRSEQEWQVDEHGNRQHWPVDHYQAEGMRDTSFLTEHVKKYHRTITTYINDVIQAGFTIKAVAEPMPEEDAINTDPLVKDETRRPMFLIVSAQKQAGA